jgi:hypothetical protein
MDNLPFNYRRVMMEMNRNHVSFLLVGGLNYFLAHKPVSTQDIDLLIENSATNRLACEQALIALGAEWGKRDEDWEPVKEKRSGWLWGQSVFCLLTTSGPVDVFLSLPGIPSYSEAMKRSLLHSIEEDLQINLISAYDLLQCQLAIPESNRKIERMRHLREILGHEP